MAPKQILAEHLLFFSMKTFVHLKGTAVVDLCQSKY